jgi:hypothetical protein
MDRLNLFSAKDAKDAKYFWFDGFGVGGRYAITACKCRDPGFADSTLGTALLRITNHWIPEAASPIRKDGG